MGINRNWARFWMRFAGRNFVGRMATRLAAVAYPPYYGRVPLARLNPGGYIAPDATISHKSLILGKHCYLGKGVLIYQDRQGGQVRLDDGVHIHDGTVLQTGSDGELIIGSGTHIQPRCQFSAYKGPIKIGSNVEIGPNCAFYSYNHGVDPGKRLREQPVTTRGGIMIDDDAWLGFGVIVLDGVHIGKGSVVGAGSVVTNDIPADGIAAGTPARVIRKR